jgi:hypothetical protein
MRWAEYVAYKERIRNSNKNLLKRLGQEVHLGDLDTDRRIILKCIKRNWVLGCKLDSSSS